MDLSFLSNRFLFDQMPHGALILDLNRRILAANRHACEYFQREEADLLGSPCHELTRFSLCAERCPFDNVVHSNHHSKILDFICVRKDNAPPICLEITPLLNSDGECVAVMESFHDASIVKDLNDRLQLEQNLLQAEMKRSKALVNSIADGIYTVDLDMHITSFSLSAERMTGFREEDVLGRKCYEVLRTTVCNTDCPLKWTLKTQKPVQNCSANLIGHNGRLLPAFLSSALLRDADGQINGCICTINDRSEIENLKAKLAKEYSFSEFVGKSKAMTSIFERINTVSATDATVLIQGESGTGKEIMARAIHYRSDRKEGPFVRVNCAALTDSLLESELFGHDKGAFTGAHKDKPGRFELAHEGTLFLDEIGDTSIALQAKLLRVLQEREYERVGGIKTRKTDVRVIAATNKNLRREIELGNFREDLFYRLCVVPIELPPLRERKEDIPLLIEIFLQKFNAHGERLKEVSSRAMARLIDYDWPGNVRELENAIEHAYVTSTTGRVERCFLPGPLQGIDSSIAKETTPGQSKDDRIIQALEAHRWCKNTAAEALGISRTTLWRKMKKLGLT